MLVSDEEDMATKAVLVDILGYLEHETFSIDASQRPKASVLKSRLENAVTKGQKIAEQAIHTQRPLDRAIKKLTFIINPHR